MKKNILEETESDEEEELGRLWNIGNIIRSKEKGEREERMYEQIGKAQRKEREFDRLNLAKEKHQLSKKIGTNYTTLR